MFCHVNVIQYIYMWYCGISQKINETCLADLQNAECVVDTTF